MKQIDDKLAWKVNTKGLFDEIRSVNAGNWIFQQPLKITYNILRLAAKHAADSGNEKLIGCMCMLGMYEFSDPTHPDFDNEEATKYINKALENI